MLAGGVLRLKTKDTPRLKVQVAILCDRLDCSGVGLPPTCMETRRGVMDRCMTDPSELVVERIIALLLGCPVRTLRSTVPITPSPAVRSDIPIPIPSAPTPSTSVGHRPVRPVTHGRLVTRLLLLERIPALLATAPVVLSPHWDIIISSVPSRPATDTTTTSSAVPSRTANDCTGNFISLSAAQRGAGVVGSSPSIALFRVGAFKVGWVVPVILIRCFTAF